MTIPFVIDNQQYRMVDAANELLAQNVGKPLNGSQPDPTLAYTKSADLQ